MKIVYSPRALRDIDGILQYIEARSPRGARAVAAAIESTIALLASHPGIGIVTDETHVYRLPLSRYRYTIFYRFDPSRDVVEIACVVHAARIRRLSEIPDEDR